MLLKTVMKPLAYRLCYAANYQKRLLSRIHRHQLLPILSLHRVSPHPNLYWPPLTPTVFDRLLQYLTKHFEIVTLHELNHVVCKKPKLVLSFDDGYYDFIDYAMPILKKYGLKANQNIIPSQLAGEKPLWNIMVYDFLNAAPISLIKEMQFLGFDGRSEAKKSNKTQIGIKISRALKRLPHHERETITQHLESIFLKLEPYPKTRMIRLNEMPPVIAEHEVGVHSYAHESMGNEPMDYFCDDFKKCKDFFTLHQFPAMDIYAFPNGSYRQEHIDYLHQNGIKHILLVNDEYAGMQSPYQRFNIAAFNSYEAIFQSLGMKSRCLAFK